VPPTSTADTGGTRADAIGAHGGLAGIVARVGSIHPAAADLLLFAAVGLAYAAGSLVAYSWFGAYTGPTFFPSVGVTVGALVLVGSGRRRAVVLAAAATAEICVNVFHGGLDVAPAAGYALANVSEATFAAFLIVAIARGAPVVERPGLGGLLVAVLVAPWLGGSIAAAVTALEGDVDAASYIGHWWLGDALGILLVGGGLIAAATEERRHGRFGGELAALVLASAAAAGAALWWDVWPAGYVPFLFTLVAAWRVGALGVLATAGVAAAVVAEAAASGESLFSATGIGPDAALVYVQVTIGVVVGTALVFVVLLHENAESRAELAASEALARELANEQAALRRVATLVARGASSDELFSAVADEVAGIIDIPVVGVQRYEADGTFTILGIAGQTRFTVGSRWPVEDDGIAGRILATGRPARKDDYSTLSGPLGRAVREDLMVSTLGVPILVEGGIWGFMIAAARPGKTIPEDVEQRLVRFTELVATAVSNATTRSELLTSRARVVSAADETRRRLERDLHDGIQQWLVALALRARKTASQAGGEESIRDEVSSLADDLVAVTDELREISRGIHPAILTDAGLDDALKALARRSPVPVDLKVDFEGRYDPTLEATVYYVAAEAITNAAKHARASSVSVRGGRRDGAVELVISDNGVGGADPQGGSGLIGLQDRVDTLGGAISVASPTGAGTTISLQLPTTLRGEAETSA
jgi:signal transduction histidine kinase